jgi:hypothetical protein
MSPNRLTKENDMTYRQTDWEFIAEELVALLLCPNAVWAEPETAPVELVAMSDLLEAQLGFVIADTPEEIPTREILGHNNTREGTHDITMPWWCYSGEEGVVDDQFVEADTIRSAGGWSDVEPEPQDEEFGDEQAAETWSEFRLYLLRQKNRRQDTFLAVFDWLRRQKTAVAINKHWWQFRNRNQQAVQRCKRLNNWTGLWLTKKQVEQLEQYRRICLRRLP